MIEFKVAALADAQKVGDDEEVLEVPIEDKVYTARRPTSAQTGLLSVAIASGGNGAYTKALIDMVEIMLGAEGRAHIVRLLANRQIDLDDLLGGTEQNPKGLISEILEQFSGRPTEPSTDSASSQPTGGRRSTGRSPGKGSTRSSSPSTDS